MAACSRGVAPLREVLSQKRTTIMVENNSFAESEISARKDCRPLLLIGRHRADVLQSKNFFACDKRDGVLVSFFWGQKHELRAVICDAISGER